MHFRALLIIPGDKPPGLWMIGSGLLSADLGEAKLFDSPGALGDECRVFFDKVDYRRNPLVLVFTADGAQFLLRPENVPAGKIGGRN